MKSPTDNRSTAKTRKNCGLDVIHHLKKGQYPSSFLGRLFNKRLALSFLAAICIIMQIDAQIYTDPVLTGTIEVAKGNLEDTHEEANKELNKLQGAMVVVDAGLAKIYEVENTWLDYLKTSYNTIQNAHQIVRITKLLVEIPSDIKNLGKAIADTPEGALKYGAVVAWSALHKEKEGFDKQMKQTYINTIRIINQLILNGKSSVSKAGLDSLYNISGDTTMSYHKASLLNSRERLNLLDQLNAELSGLRYHVRSAIYMIRSITWWGVWREISPETYYAFVDGKQLAKEVIDTF